jgi:hypothetical protein
LQSTKRITLAFCTCRYRIARDFLAIPATLAPLECVFRTGSDVVTKKWNKLTRESVQMIMYLKDWGIIIDEDINDSSDSDGDKDGDKDGDGGDETSAKL